MYVLFSNEMVYANVAELLPEPVWMNKEGGVVEMEEYFGCMVTHKIPHPDMILCMDEVGSDTSQKGDWSCRWRKVRVRRWHNSKGKMLDKVQTLDVSWIDCV